MDKNLKILKLLRIPKPETQIKSKARTAKRKVWNLFIGGYFLLGICNLLFGIPNVLALTPEELKEAINEKTKNLGEVSSQLKVVNQAYQETQDKGRTLNFELKRIDTNISQLNLHIKSSEINIEKIKLELESLDYKIEDTVGKISNKKEAVANLLRQINEADREELFITVLKKGSLAASVIEIQNLSDLSFDLGADLKLLKNYREELGNYYNETNYKKNESLSENRNLKNRKGIVESQKFERKKLLEETKNQEKIYGQQVSALEKLQSEVSSEIEAIEAELRVKIDSSLLPSFRAGVLLWPVSGGRKTQGYGGTRFALVNYRGQFHNGIDMGGVPIGSEVLAASDGEVINIGNQDLYCRGAAYGKFVVIKHSNNLTTLYGHMSGFAVSLGSKVERGQTIGYIGRTGWATGPHLHFTVFSSQTLSPARPGFPEGAIASRVCGPMPVGGDLDPTKYL